MGNTNTPAVVLLSGGLDSATVLAIAKERGHKLHALSFSYGQRHGFELSAAKKLADTMGCADHVVVDINLSQITVSALTGQMDVPKRDDEIIEEGIPTTYVPARNIIFISVAASRAEAVGASDIYLGINAIDYSGYPDCRPEFLAAMETALNLGTKAGTEDKRFSLHAPLIRMSKADIIREGVRLGVDYGLTSSCYDPSPDGRACGHCDSCRLRKKGFAEAGIPDPTKYV